MKYLSLLILLLVCSTLEIYSQAVSDSLRIDSVEAALRSVKSKVASTDTSVKNLSNHVDSAINNKIIIDQDALDSAKKFPGKVLYATYLFRKGHQSGLQWFYLILAAFVLFVLWYWAIKYGRYGGLCKDPAFYKDGSSIDVRDCTYSYARVQLLFWTLIILTCYVFFFGVTGVLAPLNITTVILLGFGVVVYATGKVIDMRQTAQAKGDRNQDEASQLYAHAPDVKNAPKPDFVTDILSDDNGVSVHRFQAVIFNLVFGIGFIGYFITSLRDQTYPFTDFTDWQFSLLGISSATYLGLKSFENNTTDSSSAEAGKATDNAKDTDESNSAQFDR